MMASETLEDGCGCGAPHPEGISAFEVYYNPTELLPPERLARMKVLTGR